MKKKVIKLIIILILIIGIVVYFNAFKPAKIYEKTANINIIDYKIEGEDSDEEYYREPFDNLISEYNGEDYDGFINDEKLVRTNSELPSDKDKDYKSIYVSLKIKNRSIFLLNNINAMIAKNDKDSRILYTSGCVMTQQVKPLKTNDKVDIMVVEMYTGDMTDEEILDYIRKQDITVYYETKFNGVKSEKISLKDASIRQN